jgi:hypothetical protein
VGNQPVSPKQCHSRCLGSPAAFEAYRFGIGTYRHAIGAEGLRLLQWISAGAVEALEILSPESLERGAWNLLPEMARQES